MSDVLIMKFEACLNPVEKFMGVLFTYKARSTGLAPPVFISFRSVVSFYILSKKTNHTAMKVKVKGSVDDRECYEF